MKGYHTDFGGAPVAVVAACPDCRARLRVRRNRRDGNRFLGCAAYPRCTFTSEYDELEQTLALRILDLEGRVEELEAERRYRAAPATDLDRKLRDIVSFAHPDHHGGSALAGELTARLNRLRDELRGAA